MRMRSLVCFALLAIPFCLHSQEITSQRAEAIRLNNLGAGYMGMQDFERARKLFIQSHQADPTLYAPRLNEGIALLNQQKYPDAKVVLAEATQKRPEDPRGWYN